MLPILGWTILGGALLWLLSMKVNLFILLTDGLVQFHFSDLNFQSPSTPTHLQINHIFFLDVRMTEFSTSLTNPVNLDRCQRVLVDEETFALCQYITNNIEGVAEPLHMDVARSVLMSTGRIKVENTATFFARFSVIIVILYSSLLLMRFPQSAPSFQTDNSSPFFTC